MKAKHLLITLIPLLITSCNPQSSAPNYIEASINVYYLNDENDTTCTVRYYGSSGIPYISIADYHKLIYRGRTYQEGRDRFDIDQKGNVYTITVAGDYTATFNVASNKMESPNLWYFKNTNLNGYGDEFCVSYDGMPFTRISSVEVVGDVKPTVIDFSKYNMKIYGDTKAVYVPITFAADLFTNENILQGAYNRKDLFFFNMTENEDLSMFGKKYYNSMYSTPLTQEYVNYVYNEVCLDFDHFLGRPGRSTLELYFDLSKGLDNALKSDPLGQTIIKYMTSTDLATFLAGASLLGYLHLDGGHSYYAPLSVGYYDEEAGKNVEPSWLTTKVANKCNGLILQEFNKSYEALMNMDMPFSERNSLRNSRAEKLNKPAGALKGYDTYTKDGDIAYIHIDGFMGEIELQNEWNKYYKGERETIPFGDKVGGAVGAIHYGVTEASKDESIKHVVIDLASNTGGSTDEMLFMIALLTGSKEFYTYNTMIESYIIGTYDFDFNFDKKFDEKDDEMLNLLNGKDVSVLTTKNGFSCGGISPIYLHDEGLFTVGEECGGGSCSVYMQYDGFGNNIRSSSPSHSVTKNGVSIDIARKTVCDATLDFQSVGGTRNYDVLYTTSTLRELIVKHYQE